MVIFLEIEGSLLTSKGNTLGDSGLFPGYSRVGHTHDIYPRNSLGNLIYIPIQNCPGAYGFLSLGDIKANAHVSVFGGDPAKITICCGNASGGLVANQMITQAVVILIACARRMQALATQKTYTQAWPHGLYGHGTS